MYEVLNAHNDEVSQDYDLNWLFQLSGDKKTTVYSSSSNLFDTPGMHTVSI